MINICSNNFNNEHIIKQQCPADSKNDFFWDAVKILDLDEEKISKLSEEQIQKVNNIAQVIALKNFSPEYALQFNHPCQIQNFFASKKLDFNATPSYNPYNSWYEYFSLPSLQIQNKEILQLVALEAGVSYDHAILFTNSYQLKALDMGVNVEQALTFGTESWFILEALKAGAKYEDALKFSYYQLEAFKSGISAEEALKINFPKNYNYITFKAFIAGASIEQSLLFTKIEQVEAFEAGNTIEDALKFTNAFQVAAFRSGIPIEQALKFDHPCQTQALKEGASVKKALAFEKINFSCEYNPFLELEPEQAKKFQNGFQIEAFKAGATVEQALTFSNNGQIEALKAGIEYKKALVFKHYYQVSAYKAGATYEQALKFPFHKENAYLNIDALKAGATYEQALSLNDYGQLTAFEYGASFEEALKFSQWHFYQVLALREGVTVAQALNLTNNFQLDALKLGLKYDQALAFNHEYQIEALKAGATYEQAITFTKDKYNQLVSFKEYGDYEEAIKLSTCIPYDEIKINPKFNKFKYVDCDMKNLHSDARSKIYKECKKMFEQEVCEASKYICVPEFAGDCESVSSQELTCLGLMKCPSYNPGYEYVLSN